MTVNPYLRAAELLEPSTVVSVEEFALSSFPRAFPTALGPHHKWLFKILGDRPSGVRAFLGAPRGSGKTTATSLGVVPAAIARGTHEFVVIVGASQDEAESRLRMLSLELEARQDLIARWPRLRVKRRWLSSRDEMNKEKELLLEGGRIVALGAGAKIRGLVREAADGSGRMVRPDLVIGDDLEDEKQARSKLRTNRLEDWLMGSVGQLGTPGRPVDIVLIGTTLSKGALADRALKKQGRFAGWTTKRFPAEYVAKKDYPAKKRSDGSIRPSISRGERIAMWVGMPLAHLDKLLDPENPMFVGFTTYSKEYLLKPEAGEGALWTEAQINEDRISEENLPIRFSRVVVAVDPSWGTKGDECGIVVAAKTRNGHAYILEDCSLRDKPLVWGKRVKKAFIEHSADRIVAEIAFGAEQVELVMQTVDPGLPIKTIRASRGKQIRAEPVEALYEKHRVHHVGNHPRLERQMVEWVPEDSNFSPDRVDALVWAITELLLSSKSVGSTSTAAGTRDGKQLQSKNGPAEESDPLVTHEEIKKNARPISSQSRGARGRRPEEGKGVRLPRPTDVLGMGGASGRRVSSGERRTSVKV